MSATEIVKQEGTNNPSNVPPKATGERERIPMSVPVQKLSVADIPGFHCHWIRGGQARISQALRAGYVFVKEDEVDLNRIALASGMSDTGNQGLGSNVSVIAGTDEKGHAQELFLMKLPLHMWKEDQAALADLQEVRASQIRGDKGFDDPAGGNEHRYSRKEQANLFTRKGPR